MRILMTADTVGGVWTYAVELCRGLRGWNCEIVLATMGALPSAEQRAQIAALPNVTLRPSAFKLEWMDDPWSHVARAGEWLLKIEEEERPDVIHLNGYVHGA